jgi:phosphatidylglycerophosphate synthase
MWAHTGAPLPARSPETAAAPRRRLATRHTRGARALARWLGHIGVRPNAVSMASLAFAACAAVAFSWSYARAPGSRAALLLVAATSIQLRLLCNLLDGMLAVEEGFAGTCGEIYNDMPDRIADVLILVGAGHAVRSLQGGVTLGWMAAILALFTAYVRVLGGSLGVSQHFIGPMAKQHRMFTLTVCTLISLAETLLGMPPRAIRIGLVVIVAGSIATAVRRTRRMAGEVGAR